MSEKSSSSPVSSSSAGMLAALELAEESFLSALPFDVLPTSSSSTGVEFDEALGRSRLHLSESNPMAATLLPHVQNWTQAWLLVLAHESGHLRLNAACLSNGEDPREPDAQLRAIGMGASKSVADNVADFQKETAIEAYCDICLAKVAYDTLGAWWRRPVEALLARRTRDSSSIGPLEGDGYATSSALEEFLRRDGALEPQDGAKIALEESIRRTTAIKKAAVAMSTGIRETTHDLSERFAKWRKSRNAQSSPTDSGHFPKRPPSRDPRNPRNK